MDHETAPSIETSRDDFVLRFRRRFRRPPAGKQPDPNDNIQASEQLLERLKQRRDAAVKARERAITKWDSEIQRQDKAIEQLEKQLEQGKTVVKGVARVPDLVGQSESEAAAALQQAGLRVGQRSDVPSSDGIGQVVSQSPAGGAEVALGTAVSIEVGGVRVPRLVGRGYRRALEMLASKGLEVGSITGDRKARKVAAQVPDAGTAVAVETRVNLVLGATFAGGREEASDAESSSD